MVFEYEITNEPNSKHMKTNHQQILTGEKEWERKKLEKRAMKTLWLTICQTPCARLSDCFDFYCILCSHSFSLSRPSKQFCLSHSFSWNIIIFIAEMSLKSKSFEWNISHSPSRAQYSFEHCKQVKVFEFDPLTNQNLLQNVLVWKIWKRIKNEVDATKNWN